MAVLFIKIGGLANTGFIPVYTPVTLQCSLQASERSSIDAAQGQKAEAHLSLPLGRAV